MLQQVIVFALPTLDVALAEVDESGLDEEAGFTLPLQFAPEVKAEHKSVTLNVIFLCTLNRCTIPSSGLMVVSEMSMPKLDKF